MRALVGLLALSAAVLLCGARSALEKELQKSADNADIHAVLVAGSDGWWNYRHQADVCHAYHILRSHGVPEENIIVLMADDVAHSKSNPFPGKIFNHPNMTHDVYEGVKIDYKAKDVTPDNFMAILKGQKDKVKGGNGRVLNTGKKDRVFVNFADHGATGLIAFPYGVLTVKQLTETLKYMHEKERFGKLVFYLEACESGSMFQGVLPKDTNIYALTASNADESSWGCYCDTPKISTCLGDLFSVNWMEDTDREDIRAESLKSQYQVVKNETNMSHVMTYGDLDFFGEPVADFQGEEEAHVPAEKDVHKYAMWSAREIPLQTLRAEHRREEDAVKRAALEVEIQQMIMKREYLRVHVNALVKKLVPEPTARANILAHRPAQVNEVECHDAVVHAFHEQCFNLGRNPYALEYVRVLANMCEHGVGTPKIVATIHEHCAQVHFNDIA